MRNRRLLISASVRFGIAFAITSCFGIACTSQFASLGGSSSQNSLGASTPTPTPSPNPTPTPTPSPTPTCQLLNSSQLTPVTNIGPRWQPSAYANWSAFVDAQLVRSDLSAGDAQEVFPMPFIDDGNGNCANITAAVKLPASAAKQIAVQIPCPPAPNPNFHDSTADVQGALNSLAAQQTAGQSLLLQFQNNCQYPYYFYNTDGDANSYHIAIPNVQDLTISGGTSLADAALLVFANPEQGTPVDNTPTSPIISPPTASGAGSFADAFNISQGGQRISFQNLKIKYQTPIIQNGVIQWNTSVPYVDFGTVTLDANQHQILTITPNNGTLTYFDPNIRLLDQTSVANPMDIDPTNLLQEGGLSAAVSQFTNTNGVLSFDITANNNNKNLPISPGPVKFFHGHGPSSATVFSISESGTPIQDISIINVQIASSPLGTLTVNQMTRGLLLDNYNVLPSSNSDPHATSSGGCTFFSTIASDIIIRNSTFAYCGDDAINVRTAVGQIQSSTVIDNGNGSSTLTLQLQSGQLGPFSGLTANTPVCVVSPIYEPLLCQPLSAISQGGGNKSISTVVPNSLGNLQALVQSGDLWFRMDRPAVRAYIGRNHMTGNRARSTVFKGSNAFIDSNVVNGNPEGIRILPEAATYFEGALPRNIRIENNQLTNTGFIDTLGAISTAVWGGGKSLVTNQAIRHVVIANNSITNALAPGIFTSATAESVDPLTSQNTIVNDNFTSYQTASWWTQVSAGLNFSLSPICELP